MFLVFLPIQGFFHPRLGKTSHISIRDLSVFSSNYVPIQELTLAEALRASISMFFTFTIQEIEAFRLPKVLDLLLVPR